MEEVSTRIKGTWLTKHEYQLVRRKTTKSHVSVVLLCEEDKWGIASNLWSRQCPTFLACFRRSNCRARWSDGGERNKIIVHCENGRGGFSPQFFFFRIFLPRSTAWTPGTGRNFGISQSRFFSSNWFSECQHPFIVTLMFITELVVPSAGQFSLSSKLYPSNKQCTCSTKILFD